MTEQQILTIQQAIDLGVKHHKAGRLPEAENIYNQILQAEPNQYIAIHNLGIIAQQLGKNDIAVELIRKALAVKPDYAEALSNLGNVLKEQGKLDDAITSYHKALAVKPDYAEALFNLGITLQKQGKLNDAVASYHKALAIKPDYADVHNNLGVALQEQGKLDDAIHHLAKSHALKPNEMITYVLNSLQGITSDNAPREYVEELFDRYAHRFENHLLNELEYTTPRLFKEIFSDLGLTDAPFKTTIDIGCGTGLLGVEFRSITDNLIGIDLSKKMIEQAEGKQLYDQLLINDLVNGLNGFDRKANLFLSADVFIYVGNLQATFEAVRKYAASDAVFAFSVEDHEGAEPFILQKTARYAHSKSYIASLVSQFKFEVLHSQSSPIRKDKQGWIDGTIYVLKLQSSNTP